MGQACRERACSVSWQTGSVGDDDRQKWGYGMLCSRDLLQSLFTKFAKSSPNSISNLAGLHLRQKRGMLAVCGVEMLCKLACLALSASPGV